MPTFVPLTLIAARCASLVLGLGLLSTAAQAQTIWHVDGSAVPGGDGLTWATAMDSLQSALDVVTTADQIWVAAGTYRPTNRSDPAEPRSARFWIHEAFQLYGGFDGTESSVEERDPELFDDTILSGDIGIPEKLADNAFRVVDVSSGFTTVNLIALLDGFRITGANGIGIGGGLFVQGRGLPDTTPSRVIVRHCTLNDNHAVRGGAIAAIDFGIVHMLHCTVERNGGVAQGGAVFAQAGVFRAVNTRFIANATTNLGGVLYADAQTVRGLIKFGNCTFIANSARLGGVAYLRGNASFAGVGSWYNCTFAENVASEIGGVIYAVTDTTTPARVDVFNSVLWNNSAPASPSLFGTGLDVRFSNVQGGYPGIGNLDVDPLFVTIDRPGAGSPVVDSGSNGLLVNDFLDLDEDGNTNEELPLDFLGGSRRLDDPTAADSGAGTPSIVDMGAYELDVTRHGAAAPLRGPRGAR